MFKRRTVEGQIRRVCVSLGLSSQSGRRFTAYGVINLILESVVLVIVSKRAYDKKKQQQTQSNP